MNPGPALAGRSGEAGARAGARAVRALVWVAALAPFLASSVPLLHRSAAGLRSPLVAALSVEDLLWLAIPALDLAAAARRRARVRRLAWLAPAAWLLLAVAAWSTTPGRDDGGLRERALASGEWRLPAPVAFGPDESDWELLTTPGVTLPAPWSGRHWLGTDAHGRDLVARLLFGMRVSLGVGVVATAIALLVGLTIGLLCGTLRGATDLVLMRVVEVVLCFPSLVLVLIVFAYLPHSRATLVVLLGLVGWTTIARLTRGELLRLGGEEFVQAALALGASPVRLALRHLLPNAMAPVLVAATFAVAGAMLAEFSLSWLGFGVAPPTPSLGQILADGQPLLSRAPWIALAPGLLIFVVVLSFNAWGEALREAWTPGREAQGRAGGAP